MSGTLVLSIDTELAWGTHDIGQFDHLSTDGVEEREALSRALELFEEYEAGVTWAVVGHLFHESCAGIHDGPAGWFDRDPGTSVRRDPLWYGPDIIEAIQNAPNQEIGFHSYSHVVFDECSRETACREFRRCRQLATGSGIEDPVFVFPRNRVGYLDELREAGFSAYRETLEPWYRLESRTPRMASMYLDYVLGLTSETFTSPSVRPDGLVRIPGSIPLNALQSSMFNVLGIEDARRRRLLSGVKQAAESDEIFHVWTHLYEFPERLEVLAEVISTADELGVDLVSMGELVENA